MSPRWVSLGEIGYKMGHDWLSLDSMSISVKERQGENCILSHISRNELKL